MCSNFWKLIGAHQTHNGPLLLDHDKILTENFIFTFNYMFDIIKVTTKKFDMVRYYIIQYKFYYFVSVYILNIFV